LAYKYLFHLLLCWWSYASCSWYFTVSEYPPLLERTVIKYTVVVWTIPHGVSYLFPFLVKIFEIWKYEESFTSDKIYYSIYGIIYVGSTLILTSHLCVDFPGGYFICISHLNQDLKRTLPLYLEDGDRTFSETMVTLYQTTWCHIPEDSNLCCSTRYFYVVFLKTFTTLTCQHSSVTHIQLSFWHHLPSIKGSLTHSHDLMSGSQNKTLHITSIANKSMEFLYNCHWLPIIVIGHLNSFELWPYLLNPFASFDELWSHNLFCHINHMTTSARNAIRLNITACSSMSSS
jgi:hypothetical protein